MPINLGSGSPLLYQVQTRDWLLRYGSDAGSIGFDRVPDSELDRLAEQGFDWLWLTGVWQTGTAGARVSRTKADWRPSFQAALPDLKEEDIVGSPFAVSDYTVHRDFGGNNALQHLRGRLANRGIKLLLGFVPNHTALDHRWVTEHPEYYVAGSEADLAKSPANYVRLTSNGGLRIVAYGRDPYFPGWPDTLQLNYGNEQLQDAMIAQLRTITTMCDGVRCDMAMLLVPRVFEQTWGIHSQEFWPRAIKSARELLPNFVFIAEVYWGLEWELQRQGFDYTYDKTLYDRLLHSRASEINAHLKADISFQQKSVRFLENHDEPRIAGALPLPAHRAAAIVTFFVPGMRLFHDGQLEGYVRKPSIHLARRSIELVNREIQSFYQQLLSILKTVTQGDWLLFETSEAWVSNWTNAEFICFGWMRNRSLAFIVAVNYADHDSQCYLRLPPNCLKNGQVILRDLMTPEIYERDSDELLRNGLYLAMPPWSYNVFACEPVRKPNAS
jgi:Alpha amylase, catalytic domain